MTAVFTNLWPDVLSRLRAEVGSDEFDNWFGSVRLESWEGNELVISVDGTGRKEWLEEHYLDFIREACAQRMGVPVGVRLTLQQPGRNESHHPGTCGSGGNGSLHGLRFRAVQPVQSVELNRRYTFESFVRGPSNELAYSAAYAVADKPSRAYNPLFVYGGCGLGKTHLMQAIGHRVRELFPHLVVVYVPAEEFVNQFVDATRRHAWQEFQARFRSVDVLLIDDIHFLAGKEGSQEQFFHTFNALHNAQKQIVLSCDRPPRDIATLEDRLRSRFEWGLIVDIGPPDLETRVAILREKCRTEGIVLGDEVTLFIANKIRYSVRELEGALVKLAAHASTYKIDDINVETAASLLSDLIASEDAQVSIDKILDRVSKHFRVKVSDILGSKRTRMVSAPRRVAMYLSRQLTSHSFPEIGAMFGNKDHSTVMHACRRMDEDVNHNEEMRRTVELLIAQIKMQ